MLFTPRFLHCRIDISGHTKLRKGKKGCISLKKECALRLVQKLIDKGDKDLEALVYAMKENEEWKCFDFDGELRYLLQ